MLPKASERTAAVGKSSGKAESGGGGGGSNRSPLAAIRKRHSTVEQDEEGRVRERELHHVRICITWGIVHVLMRDEKEGRKNQARHVHVYAVCIQYTETLL